MTTGHGSKRSQQEDAALAALLSEGAVDQAAARVGVSPATLYRWLQDPAFEGRYRRARRQLLEHAVAGLQQAAGKAVAVLVAVAEDQAAPPAARVSAAKTILDQAFRGLEVLDLADEVATLKRHLIERVDDEPQG